MTQEQKDLLIKDLCGRLPYGVFAECNDNDGSLPNIWRVAYVNIITEDLYLLNTETTATKLISVEDIKPYLFPLSSMTEEQKKELEELYFGYISDEIFNNIEFIYHYDCIHLIDWCYKNNLDINGLIPRGLANDATNLNIYINTLLQLFKMMKQS